MSASTFTPERRAESAITLAPERLADLRAQRAAAADEQHRVAALAQAAIAAARECGRSYGAQRATWPELAGFAAAADRHRRGWPLAEALRPPLPAEAQALSELGRWAFTEGVADVFALV